MYRLMRVRIKETMFADLEDHAMSRSQQTDRRVYVSDIVRFALQSYLVDQSKQQQFIRSISDAGTGACVVPADHIHPTVVAQAKCGLDA